MIRPFLTLQGWWSSFWYLRWPLRLRIAWAVLHGRSVAYRVLVGGIVARGDGAMIVDVDSRPGELLNGIEIAGRNNTLVNCHVLGARYGVLHHGFREGGGS